jgi:hypothetical protein
MAVVILTSTSGSSHNMCLRVTLDKGPRELIGFPSKMMPCKLNHNLISLGPESLSKSLGTNSKLLFNRNARFHWTLLLGPLFKVALRIRNSVLGPVLTIL